MSGERKNNFAENSFGTLNMRSYDISGNVIDAFYDASGRLIFVLDNTISEIKPNVLLVIDSDGDKKWDEILSDQYGVNLETIRPKQDNKYQKLDIEYSGLSIYDALIKAFIDGDDLSDLIGQLDVLRDSAIRHSAMSRLNNAHDVIKKTNATIIKTKEAIIRLQERLKTLRSGLSEQKKEIGRVSTKQSASKILKLESQIEATNEKLKRAKKRLESAQRRLEVATADAELAESILNMPPIESKQQTIRTVEQAQPVMVAPKYELQTTKDEIPEVESFEEDEAEEEPEDVNDVQPLFDKDPEILNESIAFKPISFDSDIALDTEAKFDEKQDKEPEFTETEDFVAPTLDYAEKPVLDFISPVVETPVIEDAETIEEKPVEMPTRFPVPDQDLNFVPQNQTAELVVSDAPGQDKEFVNENEPEVSSDNNMEEKTMDSNLVRPVSPLLQEDKNISENVADVSVDTKRSKPTFIYYLILLVLIVLSVFTLWLYQKNMNTNAPLLAAETSRVVKETQERVAVPENVVPEPEIQEDGFADVVFLDEEEPIVEQPEAITEAEPVVEEIQEPEVVEPVYYEEEQVTEPVFEEEPEYAETIVDDEYVEEYEQPVEIDESAIDKPVYETGARHEDMFVYGSDYVEPESDSDVFYDDGFYDAEEAAYQAEQGY